MSDDQQLLSWMLNKGLTPNFSFPLDACQFSAVGIESWRPHTFASMTQDLRKALREYSPGKEISVDGHEYVVGGLSFFNPEDKVDQAYQMLRPPTPEAPNPNILWYSRCIEKECGWVYGKTDRPYNQPDENGRLINETCPLCGSEGGTNGRGIVSSQWIRPEGFAPIIVPYDKDGQEQRDSEQGFTKFMKPQAFGRRPSERTSSGGRVELPAPLVTDGEEEEDENEANLEHKEIENSPFDHHVRYHVSRDGTQQEISNPGIKLVLMNTGYNGRGYWVCARCGRTEILREGNYGIGGAGHHRPYAPVYNDGDLNTRCRSGEIYGYAGAGLDKLMFGMTFRTDMAIMRVMFDDDQFIPAINLARNKELDSGIRALKEALLTEINDVYEFESREISAGFRKWVEKYDVQMPDGEPQERHRLVLDVFFYDEVPGGAGLSTMLFNDEERWNTVIRNTEERLRGDYCSRHGGCDSACIGCLLDFRNGQDHDRMNRQNGLRLLRWLKDGNDLPSLENGDADAESYESLEAMRAQFSPPAGSEVVLENGALVFQTNGERVFTLRPVSSLVPVFNQPHFERDAEVHEEVSYQLNLGDEPGQEEDPSTIFYFPMMDVSDSIVRLEQRIFETDFLF